MDTLLLLLEKGATIDYETASGTTALSAAIKQRRSAAVQILLSRGADVDRTNAHGVTPLAVAQDVGDMHILSLLQQAQVQRAAEEALTSLDDSSRQAQIASEAQQDLDLKEVQNQMMSQKQALVSKLAELHAQNAELRHRFQKPIHSA
ncbi:TPA: hypothetical protein ACH3X3_008961 [Trebouxia sp. C0006]